MNRTLKRPMFRIGGSAGTGITSGLDQPQKMANGGRTGYQQGSMPTFQASGLPGFLTQFGLNLLATPPQGNIFQTSAIAAQDPFRKLQESQARGREIQGERDFLQSEREAGQEFRAGENELNRATQLEIAGMKNDPSNVLYQISLEGYLQNLPPQVAERAAEFETEMADTLRGSVGGQKYGGVLQIDVRDPEQGKIIMKQRKKYDNKVFYDPYENNYKYIIIRNGQIAFDEFTTIPEIKFPDITSTPIEKKDRSIPDFGMSIDDPQA